ncbi:unnamed protein product [Allacma fusca]|uniref:Uncharacterized protein n=1 Tax=Allacma fusca TaxID=39272 RepID=A0A8J2L7R6_9HEXA|nr:unnamed protein product [Allacma fusca]
MIVVKIVIRAETYDELSRQSDRELPTRNPQNTEISTSECKLKTTQSTRPSESINTREHPLQNQPNLWSTPAFSNRGVVVLQRTLSLVDETSEQEGITTSPVRNELFTLESSSAEIETRAGIGENKFSSAIQAVHDVSKHRAHHSW